MSVTRDPLVAPFCISFVISLRYFTESCDGRNMVLSPVRRKGKRAVARTFPYFLLLNTHNTSSGDVKYKRRIANFRRRTSSVKDTFRSKYCIKNFNDHMQWKRTGQHSATRILGEERRPDEYSDCPSHFPKCDGPSGNLTVRRSWPRMLRR